MWVNTAPEALASGERTRLACWHGRPAHANFQSSAAKERSSGSTRPPHTPRKVRFGGTPKPAAGTAALPGQIALHLTHFESRPLKGARLKGVCLSANGASVVFHK